jgi:hypothetical protein
VKRPNYPSLRANGSRECAPDDRLREAIHAAAEKGWIASSLSLLAMTGREVYNGAALSPRALDSFATSDATTMTTAMKPMTSAEIALISGFTPRRTSE